jgi:Acetyltransferase (GNAT) domain
VVVAAVAAAAARGRRRGDAGGRASGGIPVRAGRRHKRPRRRVTTYRDVDEQHRTLEIGGTWIGRPWWRTAINTEAKLLFLRHAFETLGANRVALKTDIRNKRSQAAIARLGAVREGVLRHQYIRRDGSLRDTVMYSIIPEEWPAVKARLRARLEAHACE